jgi:hypothetical protein
MHFHKISFLISACQYSQCLGQKGQEQGPAFGWNAVLRRFENKESRSSGMTVFKASVTQFTKPKAWQLLDFMDRH